VLINKNRNLLMTECIGGKSLFEDIRSLIGFDYAVKLFREFSGVKVTVSSIDKCIFTGKEIAIYRDWKDEYGKLGRHRNSISEASGIIGIKYNVNPCIVDGIVNNIRLAIMNGAVMPDRDFPVDSIFIKRGFPKVFMFERISKIIGIDNTIKFYNRYSCKTLYFISLKNLFKDDYHEMICSDFKQFKKTTDMSYSAIYNELALRYNVSYTTIRSLLKDY